MTESQVLAAGLFSGGTIAALFVASFFWLLLIIARWKIFSKAGESGWKSLIPIYSDYVQWRIAWGRTGLFWLMVLLVAAGWIMLGMSGAYVVDASGRVVAATATNMTLQNAGAAALLLACVLGLISAYKLMKAFGHGIIWFILYLVIPNIMLLVLAFGSSRYEGPQ